MQQQVLSLVAARRWILLVAVGLVVSGSSNAGLMTSAARPFGWSSINAHPSAEQQSVDVRALRQRAVLVQSPQGVREVDPIATPRVSVRAWQFVIARTADAPQKTSAFPGLSSDVVRWTLPMKLMTKTADGRALELEPVFEISNGLMMRGDDDQFTGRISVGVLNRQDPASQLTLGEPVRFSVNGPVDEISPHDLSIDHTNLPLVVANLRARSPVAPVKLGVLVSFDPVVHDVEVPIVRPSLRLIPAQQQVWGFGLQTVQLNIQAEGLPQPAGRPVALTTSRGGFEPAMTVALDEEGTASAVLRSSGLGTASVKASSIGIPEATASVVFVFPWGFLMAVVVGAIVGTGAKAIPEGGSLRKWIAGLIGGLCGGTLAAVAWTVGVKLAEAQPAALWGEAAIFVVAGVAAYGGLQLGGGGRPPRDG